MNTKQQIIQDVISDIQRQLDSKINICLYKNGFDCSKAVDYNRVLVVNKDHFDDLNELWLDGILILQWSKFSFKSEGDKLVGSFEYKEV